MSPQSVLKADKDNFAIPYDGLIRIEMRNRGWRLDSIKIIADQKFGKAMKKKKDKRTQKDTYVYEKYFWEKEHFTEVMRAHGLSYQEFSKNFLKNFPWAKNIDDYWEERSERSYKFRLVTLYVDYDFEKKQRIDPLKLDFAEDPNFWIQKLVRAKRLLMVLESALKRE